MSQPLPYPGEPVQPRSGPPAWASVLAVALSVVAVGIAAWALLKPAPTADPVGNPAAADPEATACDAFLLVSKGVAIQTRKDLGPEPAAREAVAANARLAMAGGAAYLRDNVPSNTPAELAEPISAFADQLQTISQYYLSGQLNDDPEQAARLTAADDTTKTLIELCQ